MWCIGHFSIFLLMYFMRNHVLLYSSGAMGQKSEFQSKSNENKSLLSCSELSLKTMKKVESCPSSEDEINKSDKDGNCEKYLQKFKSNCRKEFRYHCVINTFRNETIEVCAPEIRINGFCTEFNILGGVIQDSYNYDCRDVDPPCKKQYRSTEAYLYKPCYDFSKLFKDLVSSKHTDTTRISRDSTEKPSTVKFTGLNKNQHDSSVTTKLLTDGASSKHTDTTRISRDSTENSSTVKFTGLNKIHLPSQHDSSVTTKLFKDGASSKHTGTTRISRDSTENPSTVKLMERNEVHLALQLDISMTSKWWIGIVGDVCVMAIIFAAMCLIYFTSYKRKIFICIHANRRNEGTNQQ